MGSNGWRVSLPGPVSTPRSWRCCARSRRTRTGSTSRARSSTPPIRSASSATSLREKLNDLQGKYKKDMEEKDAQLKDAQLKIINRYAKKKTSEVLYEFFWRNGEKHNPRGLARPERLTHSSHSAGDGDDGLISSTMASTAGRGPTRQGRRRRALRHRGRDRRRRRSRTRRRRGDAREALGPP